MSQQLKNQIAALQRKLAKLEVSRNGASANSPTANNNNAGPSASRRRRARRARGAMVSNRGITSTPNVVAPRVQAPNMRSAAQQGSIRIRRNEFLVEIKTGNGGGALAINIASFTWASKIAAAFDRATYHKVVFRYKAAVGTNVNGMISFSFDWDSNQAATVNRNIVLAATPVNDHPVWQSSTMALPPSRLMTRKEYNMFAPKSAVGTDYDNCPGYLLYATTATKGTATDDFVVGELWIDYDISLFGPTSR